MARITVMDYQRVVQFTDGRVSRVLGAGRHRYRRDRSQFVLVDLRPQLLTVPGQELLTADGLTVKVSVWVTWKVSDPLRYVTGSVSAHDVLYAAAQAAVRDAVAAVRLDVALADRAALSNGLRDAVAAGVADVGVTVEQVTVKDLMLPVETTATPRWSGICTV